MDIYNIILFILILIFTYPKIKEFKKKMDYEDKVRNKAIKASEDKEYIESWNRKCIRDSINNEPEKIILPIMKEVKENDYDISIKNESWKGTTGYIFKWVNVNIPYLDFTFSIESSKRIFVKFKYKGVNIEKLISYKLAVECFKILELDITLLR